MDRKNHMAFEVVMTSILDEIGKTYDVETAIAMLRGIAKIFPHVKVSRFEYLTFPSRNIAMRFYCLENMCESVSEITTFVATVVDDDDNVFYRVIDCSEILV